MINVRAYQVRVRKLKVSQQCRVCLVGTETLGYILAACPVYKWRQYKDRHDRVLLLLVKAGSDGGAGTPDTRGIDGSERDSSPRSVWHGGEGSDGGSDEPDRHIKNE